MALYFECRINKKCTPSLFFWRFCRLGPGHSAFTQHKNSVTCAVSHRRLKVDMFSTMAIDLSDLAQSENISLDVWLIPTLPVGKITKKIVLRSAFLLIRQVKNTLLQTAFPAILPTELNLPDLLSYIEVLKDVLFVQSAFTYGHVQIDLFWSFQRMGPNYLDQRNILDKIRLASFWRGIGNSRNIILSVNTPSRKI